MPRAIVLARVRGWFFMKRRGTERPMTVVTRMKVRMWTRSLNLGWKKGLLRMSRMAMAGDVRNE